MEHAPRQPSIPRDRAPCACAHCMHMCSRPSSRPLRWTPPPRLSPLNMPKVSFHGPRGSRTGVTQASHCVAECLHGREMILIFPLVRGFHPWSLTVHGAMRHGVLAMRCRAPCARRAVCFAKKPVVAVGVFVCFVMLNKNLLIFPPRARLWASTV
eukprot:scaffold248378_cov33-Tisochrysis_lutea.AAC.3